MALLERFDPPASVRDLNGSPRLAAAYHQWMSENFDTVANLTQLNLEQVRSHPMPKALFYNPASCDPGGPVFEQAITWNAFPRELLRRFGRARALVEADRLWPLLPSTNFSLDQRRTTVLPTDVLLFRPQSEYCEWRVERDAVSGRLLQVTFTSESPDYWTFLYGDLSSDFGDVTRLQERILALYQRLVDPAVQLGELAAQGLSASVLTRIATNNTQYNVYNRWNTTHGIAHLNCPSNQLVIEILLAGDATRLFSDGRGRPLTQPDALCCGAQIGDANRHSDPAIAGSINALARMGQMVTLANPVGICMDHIDTSNWQLPGGIAPSDCVEIVRGGTGSIARLVVKAPAKTGFTLSDLIVAGEPLRYGGQLAECVTVKLNVVATGARPVTGNPMQRTAQTALLAAANTNRILRRTSSGKPPKGTTVAFAGYDN